MNRNNAFLVVLGLFVAGIIFGQAFAQDADVNTPPEQGKETTLRSLKDLAQIDFERLAQVLEEPPDAERIRMTLSDCIQMALKANQDIQIVEYEPNMSQAEVFSAKGEFDPLLRSNVLYSRSSQSVSADIETFGGVSTVDRWTTTSQLSLSGKVLWGAQYNVALDVDKEESTFNNFIEEFNGGVTLSLTQPLLKNLGISANTIRVRAAKNALAMADAQVRLTVMNTLAQVVKNYWDLVGSIENLRVREKSLANAERLLAISEKRRDLGTAPEIEVLQAKAGVATRQSDLILAKSAMANAEDILKQALNLYDVESSQYKWIIPIDQPSVKPLGGSLEESSALAMLNRPEMKTSELSISIAELDKRQAANAMLPQLDLVGSTYQGGRDHYMREMFRDVKDRTDYAYSIGIQGSVPIGNRSARGAHLRAEQRVQQAKQEKERTKRDLLLRVRLAWRGVLTSEILAESNRQTRELQEANLEAEEKRLELGITTSYRLLQVEEDLTYATTSEVQARTSYEKTVIDLRLAEGTLLDTLGITLENRKHEKPVGFLSSVTPFL